MLTRLGSHRIRLQTIMLCLLVLLFGVGFAATSRAQDKGQVQVLEGRLSIGETTPYLLAGLEQGQTLYVRVEGISGNLDPVAALVGADHDTEALFDAFRASAKVALDEGADPLLAAADARHEIFLASDDDGGGGLTAALAFPVVHGGDFVLYVSSALSTVGLGTFGDYELMVGLDAPDVLQGKGQSTGDEIAILDLDRADVGVAVQEITGTLTVEGQTWNVEDLRPQDTLYVWVEATEGDLSPAIVLRNFADKPIRAANLNGAQPTASLSMDTLEGARNESLQIVAVGTDSEAEGTFRLLLGINEPDVLSGKAEPVGPAVIKEPIEVKIGLQVQQMVEVDEQDEYFTAGVNLLMEWQDPSLAFSPESCDCIEKTFSTAEFDEFVSDAGGSWPEFTIYNQQGNRWTQNQVVVVRHDGSAIYFERFTTNFQVDFDFRQFPFDDQDFLVHIDMIYPEEYTHFVEMEGYSQIGTDHGEDEFAIDEFNTYVTSELATIRRVISRFTFHFGGPRHANYYILQVFIPILLIAGVSWITFFLRDYGRRIEVATGNLLLFIAFSFSLADNYPRLGYVTFLDAVMVGTFIVNALVVVYNVLLRRMEMQGQGDRADKIDTYLDWIYPLAYVLVAVMLIAIFFWLPSA